MKIQKRNKKNFENSINSSNTDENNSVVLNTNENNSVVLNDNNKFLDELFNDNFNKNNLQLIESTEFEKKRNIKNRDLIARQIINSNCDFYAGQMINDISKTNFNKYFTKEKQFLNGDLNDIFSDNINLCMPCSFYDVERKETTNKLSWKKSLNKKVRENIYNIFEKYNIPLNKKGVSACAIVVIKYTVEAEKILSLKDLNNDKETFNNKRNINNIMQKNQEIFKMIQEYESKLIDKEIGNLYFINFKIGLDDIDLKEFLINYETKLKYEFIKNQLFIIEQDITCDFYGCLNYESVIIHTSVVIKIFLELH